MGRTPERFLGLLLLAAAVLYLPGLWTGFLSDDYLILGHLHARGVSGAWTGPFLELEGVLFYRPLLLTAYALDRFWFDLDPWGFHWTNLLLHLLIVVLVFQTGRLLSGSAAAALLAAAFVGLHPLGVNAVTWVAGRVSLLAVAGMLFGFVASLAYRRRPTPLRGGAALLGFLAGALSKEAGLVLPVFIALADRWLPPPRLRRRFHGLVWALWGGVVLVRFLALGTLVGGYGEGPAPSGDAVKHLLGSCAAVLVPLLGAVALPQPVRWGAALVVAALLAAAARLGGGRARLLLGLLWAGAMTLTIYPAWEVAPPNAERWYPAFIGGALALAFALTAFRRPGLLLGWALVVAGVPFLVTGVRDYREAGARARALRARILRTPGTGPVWVYNVPLTVLGAPFFHWGLGDACSPALAPEGREVFPVLAPHTSLGGGMAPAAWVGGAGEEGTLVWCDAGGRVTAVLAGPELARRPEWRYWADRPRLSVRAAGASFRASLPRGTIGRWYLFSPAGSAFLGSGAAVPRRRARDFLTRPSVRRALVLCVALSQGRPAAWGALWIRRF